MSSWKHTGKNIVASAGAQLCSQAAIWPSEVLKANRQFYPDKSMSHVVKNVIARDGILGLFSKGFGPAAVSNIPKICSHFTLYYYFKSIQIPHVPSALVTAAVTAVFTTPLQNITTRLLFSGQIGEPLTYFLQNNAYNGFRGTLYKDCINITTMFYLYGLFEFHPLISGGLATSMASLVDNPIDVVRTKLQTDYDKRFSSSFLSCAKYIYSNWGWRAFYAGAATRMIRAFPGGAVRFYVFSLLTKRLEDI